MTSKSFVEVGFFSGHYFYLAPPLLGSARITVLQNILTSNGATVLPHPFALPLPPLSSLKENPSFLIIVTALPLQTLKKQFPLINQVVTTLNCRQNPTSASATITPLLKLETIFGPRSSGDFPIVEGVVVQPEYISDCK